jgi:hypothetical protein
MGEHSRVGKLVINSGEVFPDVENKQSISTFGLIRSILDIPELEALYLASSNSSPIGTTFSILKHYDNATELAKRPDVGKALYDFNKAVDISAIELLDESKQRAVSIQLTVLEVLFVKQKILNQYDLKQKRQIVDLLLFRYRQIKQLNAQGLIVSGTLTVIARILYESQYAPAVQFFGDNLNWDYFTLSSEKIDDVIRFANDFINN